MRRSVTDTTGLSRMFHRNSEPYVNEAPDQMPPMVQGAKYYRDAPRVTLPETAATQTETLAAARRSLRGFPDAPLALEALASVLRSGYRAIGPDHLSNGQRLLRRPVPSAGGLYPLELYVLARDVTGLARGVYHYDSVADDMALLSDTDWKGHAEQAFLSWEHIRDAPAIICLGAVFDRTQVKYGPRGYRYVLMEAGHVAQNICLSATEQEMASLCLGGFHDTVLNRIIGLDGNAEAIVYAVAVGNTAT